MGAGTPDDVYLEWLYDRVLVRSVRGATYWKLLNQLYRIPFTWFVPNDGNRAEDGKDLRLKWAEEVGTIRCPENWMDLPCSFLEVLIALAERMEFEAGQSIHHWFWHLLENLGFSDCHDGSMYSRRFVQMRIKSILDRRYEPNGQGGLFPLRQSEQDQRKVELWYQMSAYLLQDL